jgi:hypothetical protein
MRSSRRRARSARLAFPFLLAPALLLAQAAPPELPRVTVSTVTPTTTRVLTVAAGGNLQAAIDSARPTDAIELACGATYTGHFVLPKAGAVLRPSCYAALPPVGTRMTPATAASLTLPKIVSPDYQAAIATALGANHYRLVGLEITVARTPYNYGLVLLGSGDVDQNTVASIAHDLVLDRVYLHGNDTTSLSRCVGLNSATTAIVDSYLSDCHAAGQDAQAVGGWNGPGPYLLANNYLEGSGENILLGGADPAVPNLVPSDIEILGNHIAKPGRWLGGRWSIKNLLEFKSAQRVRIEGNVFDGSWQHAQEGFGIVLWSANQSGKATWTVMQDVTFRHNVMRNVGAGFQLTAASDYPSIHARRIAITDNLIYGIDAPGFQGNGRAFQVMGDIADVRIAHNTVLGQSLTAFTLGPLGTTTTRLEVTDNILDGGLYGIIGDNSGVGAPSWTLFAPSGTFARNLLTINPDYATQFPAGNQYPASASAIGFVNLAGGDFHLAAASPYRSATATPGADVDAVLAATARAVSGTGAVLPPVTVPLLTLVQLRDAIAALDKATGASGRENLTVKAALVPVNVYLKALLAASSSPTAH